MGFRCTCQVLASLMLDKAKKWTLQELAGGFQTLRACLLSLPGFEDACRQLAA